MSAPSTALKLAAIKVHFLNAAQRNICIGGDLDVQAKISPLLSELDELFPILSKLSKNQKERLLSYLNEQAKDGWELIVKKIETLRVDGRPYPEKLYEHILKARGELDEFTK